MVKVLKQHVLLLGNAHYLFFQKLIVKELAYLKTNLCIFV